MSSMLSNGKTLGDAGGWCTPGINALKNVPLYVSEYALIKYDKWKSKDKTENRIQEEKNEIFKKYGYKYEFMGAEEIGLKIAAGDDFYYLRYLRSSGQKYVQVVHSTDGEIIYSNRHPSGYNLDAGNIEVIAKAIETGKV